MRTAHVYAAQQGSKVLQIPFDLARNARQKSIRLSVNDERGFLLSCPKTTPKSVLKAFLRTHEAWMVQHYVKLQERRADTIEAALKPIDSFEFALTQEKFELSYVYVEGAKPSARIVCAHDIPGCEFESFEAPQHTKTIKVTLPALYQNPQTRDEKLVAQKVIAKALQRLVRREALARLTLFAVDVGKKAGYTMCPTDVRVTNAATRWGSCSARGVIMLSSRLLFLPPDLAAHVVYHELAHLSHMDHSAAFHRKLEQLDTAARAHAQALDESQHLIPWWMKER